MLTALNHIALVVRDLSSATKRYTEMFAHEPVWHGIDNGVEHVRFQFSNMALEIVSPHSSGNYGDRARTQLDQFGEGIWGIAFATTDIAKARHVLQRRGIACSEIVQHRSMHINQATERLWATTSLAAENTFGPTLEVIQESSGFPMQSTSSGVVSLDHVVIYTSHPERAAALYGARLGLEMKLDRTNPDWGSRLMFFKCGDLIIEIAHSLKKSESTAPDKAWGLSWRVVNAATSQQRMANAGFNVSEVRIGRKPGTQVFTVRDAPANVPTIVMDRALRPEA